MAIKIVIAPNALKGCLTAAQVATALARGVARASPDSDIVQVPVADGGDGLAEVLLSALYGVERTTVVTGPLGDPVSATFCHVPARQLAAIEMATASGLALLRKARLNPLLTTTLGKDAYRRLKAAQPESGDFPSHHRHWRQRDE